MRKALIVPVAVSIALSGGCTLTGPKVPENQGARKREMTRPLHPETYVRVTTPDQRKLRQQVTLNNPKIALATALSQALPGVTPVPEDSGVNLAQSIAVSANRLPGDEFLTYLAGITSYGYRLDGRLLYIRSSVTKSWNLSALVGMPAASLAIGGTTGQGQITSGGTGGDSSGSSGSSDSSGSGSSGSSDSGGDSSGQSGRDMSLKVAHDEDAWGEVVNNAKTILGISATSETQGGAGNGAWLAVNERLGTIHAGGPPPKMKSLDDYLSSLEKSAHAQLHSDLLVVDISYQKDKARGIDWTAVLAPTADGELSIAGLAAAPSIASAAAYTITGAKRSGNWTLDGVLNLLNSTQANYDTHRMQATTVNGGTAYIGIGDEFSFISQINAVPDANGIVTTTATLSRVQVGLRMQVTQRMLGDGRVLVEATPIISSVKQMRELESGGQTFETPDLMMQDVTYRVIATPGETVYLGGISYKKVLDTLKSLPTPIGAMLGAANLSDSLREIAMFLNVKKVAL